MGRPFAGEKMHAVGWGWEGLEEEEDSACGCVLAYDDGRVKKKDAEGGAGDRQTEVCEGEKES